MFKRLPLKSKVVLTVAALQLTALLLAAALLVNNARKSVEIEVAAGEKSARALVVATVGSALRDLPAAEIMPQLAERLVSPRHVALGLVDAQSGYRPIRVAATDADAVAVPAWFRQLVTPRVRETRLPIQVNGRLYGFVSMTTAPADEIAEVWRDISGLFWIAALIAVLSVALLWLLVGRALRPLDGLRAAMGRLGDGDFATRHPAGGNADLAPIVAGFNALSESLERAEENRVALNRKIVELGDAERRSIAMELHDEFGPCLFGLKVKAAAISRTARQNGDEALARDADTILAIVAQIQASNSRLLTTLRPMAIGQLPLVEVLRDLFDAFRKTHPDVDWRVELPERLPETPEVIDLTVFRFLQEGTTNALRHGRPQRIAVAVALHVREDANELRLAVEDDGPGIPEGVIEGRGLSAMRDRIGAVGGRLVIGRTETGGTRLSTRLPLSRSATPKSAREALS